MADTGVCYQDCQALPANPLLYSLSDNSTLPAPQILHAALVRYAPATRGAEATLGQLINEMVKNQGRLFRGQLAYETALLAGLEQAHCERIACAMEYYHTASLLLDDLPCMDQASKRRGRVCAHLIHGEGPTILGALALITRSYALLAEVMTETPTAQRAQAHALMEQSLGIAGILNGQALDLSFQARLNSLSPARVARQKTASLLELSLCLPAILGGTPDGPTRQLRRLGLYWGLLYQGIDDCKDAWEAAGRAEKNLRQDARWGRPNLVRECGVSAAVRRVERLLKLSAQTLAHLQTLNPGYACLDKFQLCLAGEWTTLATPRQTPGNV